MPEKRKMHLLPPVQRAAEAFVEAAGQAKPLLSGNREGSYPWELSSARDECDKIR